MRQRKELPPFHSNNGPIDKPTISLDNSVEILSRFVYTTTLYHIKENTHSIKQ